MRMIRAAEDALPPNVRSVEELAQEITDKLITSSFLSHPKLMQRERMQAIWWRYEDVRRSLTEAEAAQFRPLLQSRLHAFNARLTAFENRFRQIQASTHVDFTIEADGDLAEVDLRLSGDEDRLKELCLRLRVMHRFNQTIGAQGLDIENREQITRCFQALHASQRTAARIYIAGDAPFAQALALQRAAFSLTRFLDIENTITQVEAEQRAANLTWFWDLVIQNRVNTGPNLPRLPFERSVWLRDPANAQVISQARISHISLSNPEGTALPEEIGTLRDLHFISVDSIRMRTLPETLGDLPELSELIISQSDLEGIPAVLERLPRLNSLVIVRNRVPIRVFPERLARQQYGGFGGLYSDFNAAMDEHHPPPGSPADGARHFAWLPRSQLTDIPFFLWFREKFSLPYFNIFATCLTRHVLESIGEYVRSAINYNSCLAFVVCLLSLPVLTIGCVVTRLLRLINYPIFVYNLFVNLAIEPVVTFVRENLLGYSPMVHIRDIPAGEGG